MVARLVRGLEKRDRKFFPEKGMLGVGVYDYAPFIGSTLISSLETLNILGVLLFNRSDCNLHICLPTCLSCLTMSFLRDSVLVMPKSLTLTIP